VGRAAEHAKYQLHFPFEADCPESSPRHVGLSVELYDSPWQEYPMRSWFCSSACERAYLEDGDFRYEECNSCARQVCVRNPANGWQEHFRHHSGLGHACLRCYETEILENGQPRDDFEGDSISGGMFFSTGNQEAWDAGFQEFDPFVNYLISSRSDALMYNTHARILN
jgi:hypothetical protein